MPNGPQIIYKLWGPLYRSKVCSLQEVVNKEQFQQAVSGLRFNFFKSEHIGIKVNENHRQSMAEILGRKAGVLPSTYLGLPLCHGVVSKSLWMPVSERIENKAIFMEDQVSLLWWNDHLN